VECEASWNAKHAGKPAGGKKVSGPKGRGYMTLRLDGVPLFVHRVVYALHHGVDPGDALVDHDDGNPSNNRPLNLKLATNAENLRRRVDLNSNNTSGHRGVYWHRAARKWAAAVRVDGKNIHLGLFTDKAEAARAQQCALK
jgi:hypothetical protein